MLLGVSALLLLPPSGSSAVPFPGAGRRGTDLRGGKADGLRPASSLARRSRWLRARPDPALQELPLLIHQLTGLLAAGRAPHQLWADAAALQCGGSGAETHGQLAAPLLPVLDAAAPAASLGLSPVPVFRAAADEPGAGRGSGLSLEILWMELAACVSVSERSGAPLAGVLGRYADALEGSLDQQAARETVLAGPQATVRLLTWLPAGGLALGYLLGANPPAVLAGSPLGWSAAAAGVGLSLAGRMWSRALMRRAAGP